MSVINSNDLIRNRTRYLPTCNTMPQPTASPRGQVECLVTLSRKKEPSLENGKEDGHDVELNRKMSLRESNTDSPILQPVA